VSISKETRDQNRLESAISWFLTWRLTGSAENLDAAKAAIRRGLEIIQMDYTRDDAARLTRQALRSVGLNTSVDPWDLSRWGVGDVLALIAAYHPSEVTPAPAPAPALDSKLVDGAPLMRTALEAIADMKEGPDTDYRELAVLMVAVAKLTLEQTGLR
jgi:hypothetical protein